MKFPNEAKRMSRARDVTGLTQPQFGKALGYAGDEIVLRIQVARFERGERRPTLTVLRLAEMFARHGVPQEYLA